MQDDASSASGSSWTGWRVGALFNVVLLTFCLLVEVIMLIVAVQTDEGAGSPLDGVVYSGDCATISRITDPVALLINILATIMIASSNYIMQCLCAPTRQELRNAHHSFNRYLRVGISSPVNVAHVSGWRALMWWLMALTSIPVHLLFNSAFYGTLQANDYAIGIFTSDFQNDQTWKQCSAFDTGSWTQLSCKLYTDSSRYERIDAQECIDRYSVPVINQFSNVILVSSMPSSDRNNTLSHIWYVLLLKECSLLIVCKVRYSPSQLNKFQLQLGPDHCQVGFVFKR